MTAIIVQARTGSTRLPGKVLKKVCGKTLLEYLILRLKQVKCADKIVIATTTKHKDKIIVGIAKRLGIDFFRGSEEDVLDRHYQAAKKFGVKTIVRITSDCPLIDPAIIDKVIGFYKRNKFDYVSNAHPPTFPDGMDVEIFSFKTLEKVWKEARQPSEREHVTAYIYKHPEFFRVGNFRNNKDLSPFRLTVDNPEDLVLIGRIFGALYKKNKCFGLHDILEFLRKNPKLAEINQHIRRDEGYIKSIYEDPVRTLNLPEEIVIVDTEYTSWEGSLERDWSGKNEHREIVQIGAILVDTKKLNEIDFFNIFIKTKKNPVLSDYFVKLTGITQKDIDKKGVSFRRAFLKFFSWCKDRPLYSFGMEDGVFKENCRLAGMPYLFKDSTLFDVRDVFRRYGINVNQYQSGNILSAFGKKERLRPHNGLNDARTILAGLKELKRLIQKS